MATASSIQREMLRTLPSDAARQTQWGFADRYDLQMLVQSTRAVARGPVARLVANGGRNSHEWTEEKAALLEAFDGAGITAVFMEPEEGGLFAGPKNLALALVAFELAWVDGGAATASLAGCLALAPIHERGTPEQQRHYMKLAAPAQPGEDRKPWRGAFCLTEPIPYVGVDTGMLNGKIRIVEWKAGQEPIVQIEKRGRFITNIGFANFVTAAVDSDDERIKGSCMVILEEGDPGVFDRGTPTRKMVHQLSSTGDPIFSLRIPASRIVGGYEVKDGVIIPRYSHSEVIEAVFRRTRVTVGVMTAAKLLSSVEPIIRYQRGRFRGAETATPGSVRYEMGLQAREDALHRLVDVWATGEASASLAFAAARAFDELDPLEKEMEKLYAEQSVSGPKAKAKFLREAGEKAVALLALSADDPRKTALDSDLQLRFVTLDSLADVLCPAAKLWNTGWGAQMMREAVSLMGGYGITEDCPGFLGNKWMDAQLEATYEGPEAVQRRQLSVTMTNPVFLAQFRAWIREMREIASERPGTGACALATAMSMWMWALNHLQHSKDADGSKLYQSARQGVTFPLADALCWLMAARCQILDVLRLEEQGAKDDGLAEGLAGLVNHMTDLCHVQTARASGEVGRICAELVFGYDRHPAWDVQGACGCWHADELDDIEGLIPGMNSYALDVVKSDGSHPQKAGPCVKCQAAQPFLTLHSKLDGCLTGSRLAKDRAAEAISKIMIPEALDYPA
ncbi:MAG TPA: acyl-CoA dehydrogenase family protein [Candidatus Limnocylindrales bacterium]|nr:acyl-CoA dehydrogenase family protein [Candidatus Limnocylindrales bacterium]